MQANTRFAILGVDKIVADVEMKIPQTVLTRAKRILSRTSCFKLSSEINSKILGHISADDGVIISISEHEIVIDGSPVKISDIKSVNLVEKDAMVAKTLNIETEYFSYFIRISSIKDGYADIFEVSRFFLRIVRDAASSREPRVLH